MDTATIARSGQGVSGGNTSFGRQTGKTDREMREIKSGLVGMGHKLTELFGLEIPVRKISVPVRPPGYGGLIVNPQGLDFVGLLAGFRKAFSQPPQPTTLVEAEGADSTVLARVRKPTLMLSGGNLDRLCLVEPRSSVHGSYVVWTRSGGMPDLSRANWSADDLRSHGFWHTTLMEQLLLWLSHFSFTGKFLDHGCWILTSTRNEQGQSARVRWFETSCQLVVKWCASDVGDPDVCPQTVLID